MGGLSPVLQAFFEGQQKALNLANVQSEITSRSEAAKARQQELQDIMKRFEVQSRQAQEHLDLSTKIFGLQQRQAVANETHRIMEGMRSGLIPIPGTTTLEAPGAAQMGIGGAPDIPGVPRMITTTPQPGSPVVQDVLGTPTMMAAPELATDQAVRQAKAIQQATLPGEVEKYRLTAGSTAMARLQGQLDMKDSEMRTRQYIADQVAKGVSEQHATQLLIQEMKGQQKAYEQFRLAGVDSPEQLNQLAINAVTQAALGNSKIKDNTPIVRQAAENMFNARGFREPPAKFLEGVGEIGGNALSFKNSVDNFYAQFSAPTTPMGKIRNILATQFGLKGLSPYTSLYNTFKAVDLPRMDIAIGLTPGSLSRSPKLIDVVKSIVPLEGDDPIVVAKKAANGTDIFMSAAQSKMAAYPAEQRKLFWRQFVNGNPNLLNNAIIGDKLNEAMQTGTYTPGSIYRSVIDIAKKDKLFAAGQEPQ